MSLFPRYHSHSNHHNSAMSPFWRLLEDPFFVPATAGNGPSGGRMGVFQPKFDVHETPEAFILDGEVAGITDKNHLDIHFADQQTLVIHGRVEKIRRSSPEPEAAEEKPAENPAEKPAEPSKQPTVEDEGAEGATADNQVATTGETTVAQPSEKAPKNRVWVQERSVGEFQRSFNFPAGIDQDNVKATLKDGILTITVPKMAQKGKRKINIE